MKRRTGLLVWLLAFAAVLTAQPALAGGAWPRGKDRGFVSLSYSGSGDVLGYAQHLYAQIPGMEVPEFTHEIGFYVEIGLTEELTFGVDRYYRPADETFGATWFIRRNFTLTRLPGSFGFEFGLGGWRDWRGIDDTQFRAGLSWGQGFETRWFDGWVEIDAKLGALDKARSALWKLDSTLGIKPGERSMLYLQMQSGAIDGSPTYTRAVPAYVMKLGRGISLESALLLGVRNDDNNGMKLGLWAEF
ncbi:MAG: hypothetical protein ACK5JR_08150 [Tropicimonas sp.]|uniref:hypothetical protein n=1 Tax=Tropicimonas sp. TaxID=2067044 RepID=UPI003A8A6805